MAALDLSRFTPNPNTRVVKYKYHQDAYVETIYVRKIDNILPYDEMTITMSPQQIKVDYPKKYDVSMLSIYVQNQHSISKIVSLVSYMFICHPFDTCFINMLYNRIIFLLNQRENKKNYVRILNITRFWPMYYHAMIHQLVMS
jgi:hypothetical protein